MPVWWWILLAVGVASACVEGLIQPIDTLGWPFIIGTILELTAMAYAAATLVSDLLS